MYNIKLQKSPLFPSFSSHPPRSRGPTRERLKTQTRSLAPSLPRLLAFCALCLLVIGPHARPVLAVGPGEAATNAASFLKIGAGARAIALGGAFVAVSDDASATYWNPAGLTQIPGPVISLADRLRATDTDYANMILASPIWKLGFVGLSAVYYNSGDVDMYDSNGVNTGILTDREAAIILSYAYSLSQLSLGVNAKYIYQDIADDGIAGFSLRSDGIGADISVLYKIYNSLTVGAVFHSKYKMTSDLAQASDTISDEAPLNIRAGVHYKTDMGRDSSLSFMMDLDQTHSYPLKLHTGMELVLYDVLAIRAGLDDLYAETRGADISHLDLIKETLKPTFGLGLKWKMGRRETSPGAKQSALILDYALSIEKIGVRNFFTLAYQF